MDPATRIVAAVAFWASLAALWGAFYKMWPLRLLRNTFTMHRWSTNPFQMYSLFLLMQVSLNQILIGVPFNGPQEALDRDAQIALAACNLLGSLISAYGLHLRNLERAMWVELCGYISLAGSLAIYVYLVFIMQPLPNTSFGLALTEAFTFASIHRSIQIIRHKRARRRDRLVTDRAADLLAKLEKGEPLA